MINFKKIGISLMTSKEILKLSNGEVKKSDTVNYRTLKPEKKGLFCQKIFGPYKKNCCNCTEYKKKNLLNDKCKKCGVRVNNLYLKRINIGHIKLQCEVFHIFLISTIPYYLSLILDYKKLTVEKIIYFDIYFVIESNIKEIKKNTFISSNYYFKMFNKISGMCTVKSGCEAIKILLERIDYEKEFISLKKELPSFYKKGMKRKIERFKLIKNFLKKNIRMEDYLISILPVLPCGLRPIVKVNDKFISSDINELYSLVLNRNERLRKVKRIEAPEFVLKTEKKLLQESVDCLFENGKKETFYKRNTKTPLKSISDNLKGKRGIFRNNLLGKRVDYSARSVIVVEPNIKLDYCGIPIEIAVELFRPFIYRELLKRYYCNNVIQAKENVDKFNKYTLKCLKKIIKNKYIILNRAPTLHRLSVQSFKIILVKDRAIHIHPLVCTSFNADFDGDQMGVHIPISKESLYETKILLKSTRNIISPANGNITILPTQDVILGINYLTDNNYLIKDHIEYFDNVNEVLNYYFIKNEKNYCIYFKLKSGVFIKTSCRRILFFSILPEKNMYFKYNKTLYKKDIYDIIYYVYNKYDKKFFFKFIYKILELGFYYATKSGISISSNDLKYLNKDEFKEIINDIMNKLKILRRSLGYSNTFLNIEKKIFSNFYDKINNEMINFICSEKIINKNNKIFKGNLNSFSKIYISGSKGSEYQINQISGVRGFMMKTDGTPINTPVLSNFYIGLNTEQYFLSSHGARKGLSDTSLKTANSGYLTRRLVDVSHDLVIKNFDCKTSKYSRIFFNKKNYIEYLGYYTHSDIFNKNKILLKKNSILNDKNFSIILDNKINYLNIRTPVFCALKRGICSLCYGIDFSKNSLVNSGQSVGIIAAQSIGEPGTQLTMRTFHTGGVYITKKKSNIYKFNKYCFLVNNTYNMLLDSNKNCQTNNDCSVNLVDLSGKLLYKGNIKPGIRYNNLHCLKFSKIKFLKKNVNKKNVLNIKNVNIEFINFNNNYKFIKKKKNFFFYINYNKVSEMPYIIFEKNNEKVSCFLYNNYVLKIKNNNFLYNIKIYYYKYSSYHRDINDSLLEVSNLFENRINSNYNSIQYYDGVAKFNRRGLFINNDFLKKKYKINTNSPFYLGKKLLINKGVIISNNQYNLNKFLELVGINNFTKHFVKELNKIYGYHNIKISRKHYEVIIRKMISYVKITKKNDSKYYQNQIIKVINYNKKNSLYKRNILGITKVSLDSDSFISSSSFQDTVKILLRASIFNKIDKLRGLKENVIIGKFIPAGTGIFYNNFL
ncbi:DNA-directed RNA polymerase subunit beta' [Candidatus Vidania fulgoroideorum]